MTRGHAVLMTVAVLLASCGSSVDRGQRLYAQHGCAVCHGPAGKGDGPTAPRLDFPPRDFADRRAYRNGPGPDAIAASIRNGSGPRGAMPAFRDLTDAELRDLAAWIVSRQSAAASR